MKLRGALPVLLVSVLAAAAPAAAGPPSKIGTMTAFPLTQGRGAGPLAAGLDGNLWVSQGNVSGQLPPTYPVAVVAPLGKPVKQIPDGGAETLGPDGNFWFARGPKVGRMT